MNKNETHIFFSFTSKVSEKNRLEACWSVLSSSEREQCRAFHFDSDRLDYLVSHALVRTTLSQYLAVPADDLRFRKNDYGKPYLDRNIYSQNIKFNLSHTSGMSVLSVTLDRQTGIDTERVTTDDNKPNIAKDFFSEKEYTDLFQTPKEERSDRFYDYWTLKESYIKARGRGLSIDLSDFSYLLTPRNKPIRISFPGSIQDNPQSWQFALWNPAPDYRAALAVRIDPDSTGTTLRFFETIPCGESVEVCPDPRTGTASPSTGVRF